MPTREYKISGKAMGALVASYLGYSGPLALQIEISLHPHTGDASVVIVSPDPPDPPEPVAATPPPPEPRPHKVLPAISEYAANLKG